MGDYSDESSSVEDDASWIEWFCGLPQNEYYVDVDRSYIEDNFNMYGLRTIVPQYPSALDIILDESDAMDMEDNAKELYGLVHARYIITTKGLEAMRHRYEDGAFGVCPRAMCNNQKVVPVGLYDEVKRAPVKLFCPRCMDVYASPLEASYPADMPDGAHFGTTFAHLFFLQYPELDPGFARPCYVPRVFGYRVRGKGPQRDRLSINADALVNSNPNSPQHTPSGAKRFASMQISSEASKKTNPNDVRSRKRRAVQ